MRQFFNNLYPSDDALFVNAKDDYEINMGTFVRRQKAAYKQAHLVLLGVPQDEGVVRNKGRAGAAQAPHAIRQQLYRFPVPASFRALSIFDGGDIRIDNSLEETHQRQYDTVKAILGDGKDVIVLGGGNDIAYPDCSALAAVEKNFLALNIDSHLDVRHADKRHSGTPYRQLLDQGCIAPHKFCEFGWQSLVNDRVYVEYLKALTVHLVELSNLRQKGIERVLFDFLLSTDAAAVFWGVDIDSVRAGDAPGASAPYPCGLSAEEILRLAFIAGEDKRSRLFEISEVNPVFDIDDRTCRLAALMVLSFLDGYGNRKQDLS